MKLFLTGAQSFIGQEIVRQCEKKGIDVVGIDAVASASAIQADIRDPDIADHIPENVDAIIHLAALSRDPDCRDRGYSCFDVNVMGTLNLVEAAVKRNARQFIFASSEWVYDRFEDGIDKSEDDPVNAANLTSEYALSKYVSEQNLRQKHQHGFCPVTVLRYGIVYGSRTQNWSAVEALYNTVKTQTDITVGSVKTSRRFIHVSDIADATLSAVGTDGYEIVNIQGARPVTLGDVIETSAAILGRTPKIVESAPDTPSIRSVSSEKATRLLGWEPKIDLETGLRRLHDFLEENAS